MRVTWLSLEWPRLGFHSGGVGRYAARMAQRVAEMVELTVVTFAGGEEIPGVRLVTIPAPIGRFDRYYTSAWRARAAVSATVPDLVHAHGDDYFLTNRVPIVRTFYGLSLSEAVSSRGLRRLNHLVLAGLEQWSSYHAAVRLGIAVEAVKHFRCEDLFPPFFGASPVGQRMPAVAPTIVFIGSFAGRKQGWLAQSAVAALREKREWCSSRLVVIGPQNDACNWETWVEHYSSLSDGEVSSVLSSAWLLVSPSSYEGFGIPIVEALAHEVAVVAVDNPGSSFIFNHSDRRVPLTLTNEDGFVDAVFETICRGPYLNRDFEGGARHLVESLTKAGSPERLVDIYKKVLATRGGP